MARRRTHAKAQERKLVRVLLIIAGTVCVGLGVAGIFLPLLPATPFLLLASACYVRASERLHARLVNSRLLGPYIRNFRERRGMPRRAKIYTIALLWASILFSVYTVENLYVRLLLLAIAATVTVLVLRMRTLHPEGS